jgi:Sulfate permease family
VITAISVSWAADLPSRSVAVVGPVPRGLPSLGLPALGWHDAAGLLGAVASMFVVILAQSAAASRAYAVKYEEPFSEDTDLVGLGTANAARCDGWSSTARPSETSTTPYPRSCPGSLNTFTGGTSASPSAPPSARCASSSTATASPRPSARRLRHSGRGTRGLPRRRRGNWRITAHVTFRCWCRRPGARAAHHGGDPGRPPAGPPGDLPVADGRPSTPRLSAGPSTPCAPSRRRPHRPGPHRRMVDRGRHPNRGKAPTAARQATKAAQQSRSPGAPGRHRRSQPGRAVLRVRKERRLAMVTGWRSGQLRATAVCDLMGPDRVQLMSPRIVAGRTCAPSQPRSSRGPWPRCGLTVAVTHNDTPNGALI